jgi:Putative prokaryotic signal transducing protein
VDELVVVDVVRSEPEAELLCSFLRDAGIECAHRLTNVGAGAFEGLPSGGPREVVVRAEDAAAARELLEQQDGPAAG